MSEKDKTEDPNYISLVQKLSVAFFGISNPRPQNKKRPNLPFQTIRLQSNKEIECWFIKAGISKGTVIMFYGYGGEKSSLLDKASIFKNLGYNTLLVDFMGAGGSEGNQTTIGFKEAREVETCVNFIKRRGETNIILFGTSLGATAIMKALNENKEPAVRAIIIECPFSTMLKTVKNRFAIIGIPAFPMAYFLVFWGGVQNGFNAFGHNPVNYAKNIKCPALLLYGEKDQRVTPEETRAIFTNLSGPKTLVTFPLAAHENYLIKYREAWAKEVTAFLKRYTNK
ncbi:MAG: alpha/beta hydrolase [Ginsengibacter sp.]